MGDISSLPPASPLKQEIPTAAPAPSRPVPNFLDADEGEFVHSSPSPDHTLAFHPPRPPNPELLRLHAQIHKKIVADLAALGQAIATDSERLRAVQADLLTGEPAIRDEMARLVAVRDVCRSVADRLRSTVGAAESNIGELKRRGDPEVDELVCSTAIIYNQ